MATDTDTWLIVAVLVIVSLVLLVVGYFAFRYYYYRRYLSHPQYGYAAEVLINPGRHPPEVRETAKAQFQQPERDMRDDGEHVLYTEKEVGKPDDYLDDDMDD